MNAAMPPAFCAFARACSATVVLPLLSGPYTSTIRPRGRPPRPRATSRAIEPVGITSTGTRACSPSRMTEPLPNCRSIWTSAASRALSLSPALSGADLPLGAMRTPCRVVVRFRSPTLRATTDISGRHRTDQRKRALDRIRRPGHVHYRGTVIRAQARHAGLFDGGATGTTGPFGIGRLTEAIGDVERVAHGPPDDLRILAIGQRLVDGTPTEARQNVIFRK